MESGEAGKRRGRRAGKRDKRTDETPRKCTVVLSAKMDVKLSAYSTMRGINRSAVVAEALEAMLGSMVVSFRGAGGDAGPVEPPRIARAPEGEGAAA